jgi:hypothetical protein
MDTIAFYGSIATADSELASGVLREWLETTALDIKVGRIGVEIVFEDAGFYLYCYEAAAEPGQAASYLLEGHLEGALDEARARLERLVALFRARSVEARIDYVQVDENGDWLGEELSV